jgi:alpha-glucosidase (family GH31 glycosyl hydrolase)
MRPPVLFGLSILIVSSSADTLTAQSDSRADPRAIVEVGQARFTVLTPAMIRMEWAEDSQFEDRASILFLNRRLPVPEFTVTRTEESVAIETNAIRLRYRHNSGMFDTTNLRIEFAVAGETGVWRPGASDTGNLGGTVGALDGATGPLDLGTGLVSREGWVLIDDTSRPIFDRADAPWVAARPDGKRLDWYFLGHGRDYEAALGDFAQVAGRIPLPPRYAFGLWWSRYWAYTDHDLMSLVAEFERRSIPLDVLVIDMDWHETLSGDWGRNRPLDQAGEREGWTGYTWNLDYFPDPEGFLDWTEQKGLRTPLNMHPASGIQPHEIQYEAMARAMGIDPATRAYVPFALEDPQFVDAYFDLVIHPLEQQGVDFWWLDWRPNQALTTPGLDPTWWVNHLFYQDMERQGRERPLIMHRYGGLGNHRYPIGFSGDTYSTWDVLAFLPTFTATASNVLFGYWSHDIGGHLGDALDPELYTRWVQFGALSPILRTHATKLFRSARAMWDYPYPFETAMREAVQLRRRLLPYVYTAARRAHDTGVSIVRPMYYEYPEHTQAYEADGQYMLGPDLIVSPIVDPREPGARLVAHRTWLPPGEWYEWPSGLAQHGGRWVDRRYSLFEIPIFVRSGAVVPMEDEFRQAADPLGPIKLGVFPGERGSTRIYEDDGRSQEYQRGHFAWTSVAHSVEGDEHRIEIGPTGGEYTGFPSKRRYEIHLIGAMPPRAVLADGRELEFRADRQPPGWWFDGELLETVIALPEGSARDARIVRIVRADGDDVDLLDGVRGDRSRLREAREILDELVPVRGAPESLISAIQTGRRIEIRPGSARAELTDLRSNMPRLVAELRAFPGRRNVVNRALVVLGEEPLPPVPQPRRRFVTRRRLMAALIGLMALGALAALYFGIRRWWS